MAGIGGLNNCFRSVAIDGTIALIGAHYDDDNGSYSGSAYVYRFDGSSWVETKLLASDGASSELIPARSWWGWCKFNWFLHIFVAPKTNDKHLG
ncbi:MAG: FG-GAP repeat protein [Phycisphaerales bacterium]|nr:FG-GAP repeat protein [Phycisphaerales bacterium]